MALSAAVHNNGQNINFFSTALSITTAVTGQATTPVELLTGMHYVAWLVKFTYGSSGTTAKFWLQTTLDGGVTWMDIANLAFTTATASRVQVLTSALYFLDDAGHPEPDPVLPLTPGDAALGDNLVVRAVLGSQLRVKYTTTGTYADTSVLSTAVVKG